nr:ATP-dependent DNA helicase PIF1-like [Hydra vulgaris]
MFNVIELNESFRQENIEFFNALNKIRIGKVSDKTVDLIMTRHFEVDHNINPNYIRLFFTNMEVDFYNSRQLMNIPSDEHWFHSKDVIKNSKINPMFQIPYCINIKIGAVVMLVQNINVEEGLCNGTISVVSFIETDGVWVIINGKELKIENVREDILDCTHNIIASRIGLPLQLAFSLTVHKAQDEDFIEGIELNGQIQTTEEITHHINQKTQDSFLIETKKASSFADLFQKILIGYNIVTLCGKSTEDGHFLTFWKMIADGD